MKIQSTNCIASFNFINLVLVLSVLVMGNAIAASTFSKENGVVTDSNTSLQWQDDYQDNNNEIKTGAYADAQDYCSTLTLADQNDWRLPTREELLSIVDSSRVDDPAIDVAFENIAMDEEYLTTTNYEDDEETVWVVDFTFGVSNDVALIFSDGYFVRCVRNI